MAPVYMMSLEERVDLARTRLDRAILRLARSVEDPTPAGGIQQAVSLVTAELRDIGELIGR
jgi:hypothetical protein